MELQRHGQAYGETGGQPLPHKYACTSVHTCSRQSQPEGLCMTPHPPTGSCPPVPALPFLTNSQPWLTQVSTHSQHVSTSMWTHKHTYMLSWITDICIPPTPAPSLPTHMPQGLGTPCTCIRSNLQPSESTDPHTSPCRHPATSLALIAPRGHEINHGFPYAG